MKKRITLFGGGKMLDQKEYDQVYALGKNLAEAGHEVQTGGYSGLMNAFNKGAASIDMKLSFGVPVQNFKATPNTYSTLKWQKDIYDRLRVLIEESDAFIVASGGPGTLSELALVIDCMRKLADPKPIYVVGQNMREIVYFLYETNMIPEDNEYLHVIGDYDTLSRLLLIETEMLTSMEWSQLYNRYQEFIITDPDGWDRKHYKYSFYSEPISEEEFLSRLNKSTIIVKNKTEEERQARLLWHIQQENPTIKDNKKFIKEFFKYRLK